MRGALGLVGGGAGLIVSPGGSFLRSGASSIASAGGIGGVGIGSGGNGGGIGGAFSIANSLRGLLFGLTSTPYGADRSISVSGSKLGAMEDALGGGAGKASNCGSGETPAACRKLHE